MNSLLMPILMIMSGILIGVILRSVQKHIKIPYTVALFAIGLLIGFFFKYDWLGANDVLGPGIKMVADMNPDFILYVFLPILVFDAAYEMDLHVFKKTLVNSTILAVPGVVICMLLTGGLVMLLADCAGLYDNSYWKYALMFGGLISATDPIAVVALLKELGTSKRFSTLVDGEALLNDGTGIVCFMLFYSEFCGKGPIHMPAVFFLWVCLVSCAIGYLMVKAALFFTTRVCTNEVVQNCVMIVAAYLTFILAQSTLEVSGVIALVVFGHIYAQSGKTHLKPGINEFMEKFWGLLTEIANTLIFLMVGIIIATQVNLQWLRDIPAMQDVPDYVLYISVIGGIILVYIGLNIIRYIMIAILYPALKRIGYGLTFKESIILGWGGLRGAVAMTLALMVSCNDAIPENIRSIILILTAGTITLTLCINATTSKLLVKKLKLDKQPSPFEKVICQKTIETIRHADDKTLKEMMAMPELSCANWNDVSAKIIKPVTPDCDFDVSSVSFDDLLAIVRKSALSMERSTVESKYHRGLIDHRTYMNLITTISMHEDYNGYKPLDEFEMDWLTKLTKKRLLMKKSKRIHRVLDGGNGLLIMLNGALQFISNFDMVVGVNSERRMQVINALGGELKKANDRIDAIQDGIKATEPELYAKFITEKATKLILASERDTVNEYTACGIIVEEDAAALIADIDARQGLEVYD